MWAKQHPVASFPTQLQLAFPTQVRMPQGKNLLAPREQVPSRGAMARTIPYCSDPHPSCCTRTKLQRSGKFKSGNKNYEASSCRFQNRFAGVRTEAGCTGEVWCTRTTTRASKFEGHDSKQFDYFQKWSNPHWFNGSWKTLSLTNYIS